MKRDTLPSLADAKRVEQAKAPEDRGYNTPQRQKFQTSDGFVLNLMNVSPFGALSQLFVMEAIRHYSTTVAANDPGPEDPNYHGIAPSPQVWHKIAVDIRDRTNIQLKIK